MKNNLRFPHERRLLTKAEYKAVFDKSQKISQKHLMILYKVNQKPYARLGLVVPKRVARSAVTRNGIKRILRESFRHHPSRLIGVDIIIIARQQCDTLSKQKLREGIDKLWEKLQQLH